MSKNKTKIVTVNLAREMIKAVEIDFSNGNHKSIVSIDFIEKLMHKYHEMKVKNEALNIADVGGSLPIESFDADAWLGENRDIFNHPYIKDRTNVNGYEVAQLMADFANSIIQK